MKKNILKFDDILNWIKKKNVLGWPLDDVLIKALLVILLILVVASMFPKERPFEYSNLVVGSISNKEIIAGFTFPIIKSEKVLNEEREQAAMAVPPVFDRMPNTVETQRIKLKNMFGELNDYFARRVPPDSIRGRQLEEVLSQAQLDSLLNELHTNYNLSFSNADLNNYYLLFKNKKSNSFYNFLVTGLSKIYQAGIMNIPKASREEERITLLQNGISENVKLSDVMDVKEATDEFLNLVLEKYKKNNPAALLATKIIPAFLVPDLIYNDDLTRPRKEKAIDNVSTTSGFVYKNQRIVDEHEVVTEEIYQKLQSLAQAERERSALKQRSSKLLFYLGRYLLAALMTLILGLFIKFFTPELFSNNKKLILITSILLVQFFLTMLIMGVLDWNYLSIPVILGPMLLSMLLNSRVALWGTVMMSMVLGASYSNNYYLTLMTLFLGVIALLSVRKIRNRGQMFKAILYVLAGCVALNYSWGFLHFESFRTMTQNFVFYLLPNSILTPTTAFLLIGVFERLFDVTTDVTLLELSDLNRPLLKKLSVEAPGTFHHSIIVGNLAESAAEAIGADALLARVGCYYHDIGKLQKSEYFVENQAGGVNKHEGLTPSMSSLILANHVKAGLELAEENNLPRVVKQFIPEHHGTNIMTYFYHKAKEMTGEEGVNADDFRYPGPKPQSKETAIAMLADAVEAASRTITNPNVQKLSALVDEIIKKRFQEGQLDSCNLTLRDLTKIKEAFVPILVGIHHLRIEYPSDSDDEKEKKGHREKQSRTTKESGKMNSMKKESQSTDTKEILSRQTDFISAKSPGKSDASDEKQG